MGGCVDRNQPFYFEVYPQLADLGKVLSICVDCNQPCYLEDEYMVPNKLWASVGMVPRNGKEDKEGGVGRLHLSCLEKRLGRKVTDDELLYRFVRHIENGSYQFAALSEDVKHRAEMVDWSPI
jgi:hypothetical protein